MILIPISNLPDLFTKFEKINLHLPEKMNLGKTKCTVFVFIS